MKHITNSKSSSLTTTDSSERPLTIGLSVIVNDKLASK